jgi:hypothetical protein
MFANQIKIKNKIFSRQAQGNHVSEILKGLNDMESVPRNSVGDLQEMIFLLYLL